MKHGNYFHALPQEIKKIMHLKCSKQHLANYVNSHHGLLSLTLHICFSWTGEGGILQQGFSKCDMPKNHLESLLTHIPDPTLRNPDSGSSGAGTANLHF